MSRSRLTVAMLICVGVLVGSAGAQDYVHEPARRVPVLHEADVVGVGGGLSGVGAALGAARTGAKTILIERTGYLGGWLRGTGMGNVLAIQGPLGTWAVPGIVIR